MCNDTSMTCENSITGTVIGSVYILLSIFSLIIYSMTIFLMHTDKVERNLNYFRFIQSIALADFSQSILLGIVAGIFTLTKRVPFWLNKFLGSILAATWYTFCFNAHLLAISRFFKIVIRLNNVFSEKMTKIYIGLLWLGGLIIFGIFMLPDVDFVYDINLNCWGYGQSNFSVLASNIEIFVDGSNLVAIIIWYTIIFVYLKIHVSQLNA